MIGVFKVFWKIFKTLFGSEGVTQQLKEPGYSLMGQHSPTLQAGRMGSQITCMVCRTVWQPISKVQTGMMQAVARTITLCARKKRAGRMGGAMISLEQTKTLERSLLVPSTHKNNACLNAKKRHMQLPVSFSLDKRA